MTKTKNSVLAATLVLCALTAAGLFFPGRESIATGIGGGLAVATIGLLLFVLSPAVDVSQPLGRLLTAHIAGALLFRIPLMCLIFAATILLIRLNTVGILIGVTIGALIFGTIAFARYVRVDGPPEKH